MLDCSSSRNDLNKFPRDHCLPCAVVGQLQLLDHISCKEKRWEGKEREGKGRKERGREGKRGEGKEREGKGRRERGEGKEREEEESMS